MEGQYCSPSNTVKQWVKMWIWESLILLAAGCKKRTTLINLKYRLLQKIVPTNTFLTKLSIKQYPNWSFCNNRLYRNLIHLFWLWETTKHFGKLWLKKFKTFNWYQRTIRWISLFLGQGSPIIPSSPLK